MIKDLLEETLCLATKTRRSCLRGEPSWCRNWTSGLDLLLGPRGWAFPVKGFRGLQKGGSKVRQDVWRFSSSLLQHQDSLDKLKDLE